MSNIPNKYNPEHNFWDSNPQFLTYKELKEFHKKDKSKKKSKSSQIMWAISLVYDIDSEFAGMPLHERKESVELDLPNNQSIDWDSIEYLIDAYLNITTTSLERTIIGLRKKFYERDTFLQNTPYSEKNADKLDRMFEKTGTIAESIEKLHDRLNRNKEGATRGDMEESASEKGEI